MNAQNPTDLYIARRKRLVEKIGDGMVLINSSGPAPDPMLWDRNLQYLTGLDDRQAYLLIAPGGVMVDRLETCGGPELMRGRRVHEILFVQARSEQETFMDGAGSSLDDIKRRAGVDRVYSLSKMEATIKTALMYADTLWLNTPNAPGFDQPLDRHLTLINQLRERFYWVRFENIAPIIHQMRFVKDAYEAASLREAFQAHTEIYEKIMRTLKPGDNETLGQAIFDYEVGVRGLASMGVEHYHAGIIVASGPNSAVPHYMDNNREIEDGDLVLIDGGVCVNGYFSDLTRTFPANGRFSPHQRELYEITYEALQAAIAIVKPGTTLLDVHQTVYNVFDRYGLAQYGYGNCGHPVGLSIHDPHGRYADDREQPFEPGVALVIEPFLMLPEEHFGIRIEDGVLVTETGYEVLPGPPKQIDRVEALCQSQ